MEQDNSLTTRILSQLEEVITTKPNLIEFTIVPTEDNNRNKSPVLLEELSLGLESWCIKYLYRHVCTDLFAQRQALAENKLSYHKKKALNRLLIGALLIHSDVSTFWNMKRELVQSDILNSESELHFAKIVLSYKSKSNEAFSYRRWLLTRIISKLKHSNACFSRHLLHNELNVVDIAREKEPHNYHAWTHRIWCMENLAGHYEDFPEIVFEELRYNYEWIVSHVSENTGYHYRQYLINLTKTKNLSYIESSYFSPVLDYLNLDVSLPDFLHYLLGKETNSKFVEEADPSCVNYVTLLLYDLFVTVERLSDYYPEHETMWYHRRFLISGLINFAYSYHKIEKTFDGKLNDHINNDVAVSKAVNDENGEKQAKLFKWQSNKVECSPLYQILLNSEQKFIEANLKSLNAIRIRYADRHQKWLKFVIGFQDI